MSPPRSSVFEQDSGAPHLAVDPSQISSPSSCHALRGNLPTTSQGRVRQVSLDRAQSSNSTRTGGIKAQGIGCRAFSPVDHNLIVGYRQGAGTSVDRAIALLHSWIEEFEEGWQEAERNPDTCDDDPAMSRWGNKVFAVHGHDEATRKAVTACLERLELGPVVLHEPPNQGSTVIEKSGNHLDVVSTVALPAPGTLSRESPRRRLRRATISGLGFLIEEYGPKRVRAFMTGDIHARPGDEKRRQIKPFRESRTSGLDASANRALWS